MLIIFNKFPSFHRVTASNFQLTPVHWHEWFFHLCVQHDDFNAPCLYFFHTLIRLIVQENLKFCKTVFPLRSQGFESRASLSLHPLWAILERANHRRSSVFPVCSCGPASLIVQARLEARCCKLRWRWRRWNKYKWQFPIAAIIISHGASFNVQQSLPTTSSPMMSV